MATMVNMNSLLNGKDSRWLQLEVCREFQRNKCSRPDTECKFAHPPANVEVQNGRVTACYDSIKGRCNREKPPCKYFHPPQHLKDQLLINGRNHLALKNALMQQMGLTPGQVLPGQVPSVVGAMGAAGAASAGQLAALDPLGLALLAPQASNPYLGGVASVGGTYAPYAFAPQLVPLVGHDPSAAGSPLGHGLPAQVLPAQKLPRNDRLEVCREFQRGACKRAEAECRFAHPAPPVAARDDGCVTVCMDAVKGRCGRDPCRYFHPPLHLQAHLKAQARGATAGGQQQTAAGKKRPAPGHQPPMDMKSVGSFYYENFAFPGMVPYKRPAADKAGMPVYQPATTYQQLMQLQQPFVPVSCCAPANARHVVYTDERGQVTRGARHTASSITRSLPTRSPYWTPSRCAKILIVMDAKELPASLCMFVKAAGCRCGGRAWWCVATRRRARVAAPPAATTTSPCSCRPHTPPRNHTLTLYTPTPQPHNPLLKEYIYTYKYIYIYIYIYMCVCIYKYIYI